MFKYIANVFKHYMSYVICQLGDLHYAISCFMSQKYKRPLSARITWHLFYIYEGENMRTRKTFKISFKVFERFVTDSTVVWVFLKIIHQLKCVPLKLLRLRKTSVERMYRCTKPKGPGLAKAWKENKSDEYKMCVESQVPDKCWVPGRRANQHRAGGITERQWNWNEKPFHNLNCNFLCV